MTAYRRMTLYERQKIEEGLDANLSFRKIAQLVGKNVTSVSREVKTNRYRKEGKDKKTGKFKVACREKKECNVIDICKNCTFPKTLCRSCPTFDCRGRCSIYRKQGACDRIDRAPFVCNGCQKRSYGCSRSVKMVYAAHIADIKSTEIRSESRRGFDMGEIQAKEVAAYIKEGLNRGLSPYEIGVAYASKLGISESTIYRMVEAGVGGCANIELERKVGFKPRDRTKPSSSTKHATCRSYKTFMALGDDRCGSATEMDCIEGRKSDLQAALTLYVKPAHLQIALLLAEQNSTEVEHSLRYIKSLCTPKLFSLLFETVITDNGGEFSEEDKLDELFGGSKKKPHLFYCDPGHSDQKARCEKNHSELRQIIPKKRTPFDELDSWDMAVATSHANSNPRKSLGGKSPIQLFKLLYGKDGEALLDALGVTEIPLDELTLKPYILDKERRKRGLPPINWQ